MRRKSKSVSADRISSLRWVVLFAATLAMVAFSGDSVAAQADSGPTDGAQAEEVEVSIGFGGVAKLGHWVPVTFDLPAEMDAVSFRITTLDGDDTPATVTGQLQSAADKEHPNRAQGMMQFGRTYGSVQLELLNGQGEVVFRRESNADIKKNSLTELVPSTAGMVLLLEPKRSNASAENNGSLAEAIGTAFSTTDEAQATRVISVNDIGELPESSVAFSSCETIVLLTDSAAYLETARPETWNAIESWVRGGGQLIVSASSGQVNLFKNDGVLTRFTPGTATSATALESSRRIEELSSSKDQFLKRGESIDVLGLTDVNGRVFLQQGKIPLVIRQPVGLGEVMFVTLDLAGEKFVQWPGSNRFVQSLLNVRTKSGKGTKSRNEARSGSAVRHSGYQDMVGQLKVPLERFSTLKFIPFALVAALIAVYILCVGVGDWFLVGRVFRRHELTWLTFPLLALLFCGIAWWLADFSRPSKMQLNQVEIVDVDSVSGYVRSTAWSNLYSPRGGKVSIDVAVAESEQFKKDASVITWQGLPGNGLGGMLNRANPGLYRSGYSQEVSHGGGENPVDQASISMKDVELQVSSTRPLFVQWNGQFKGEVESGLIGGDRLEGTFSNPFNVPLKNCRLFYEDLVYVVGSRGVMKPGVPLDVFSETSEKNIRSFMTRRFRLEGETNKSQSVAWNPRDRNLPRIANMMMFYRSSGGQEYVGLSHAYHEFVEMTPTLSMDRAILVGELENRVSELKIDDQPAGELYDTSLTMVRVVLPVRRTENK